MFSNVQSVLSQCNTQLRRLHLLYDVGVMRRETMKGAFSMFYILIKHGPLTNQSTRPVPIYMITFDDKDLLHDLKGGHLLVVCRMNGVL